MFKYNMKMRAAIFAVKAIHMMNDGPVVKSKALAVVMDIAPRYLEKVFQALVRSGILVGVRGHGGGYRLKRPGALTTVGDIIQVVIEVDDKGTPNKLPLFTQSKGNDKIDAVFKGAEILLFEELYSLTIADLNT